MSEERTKLISTPGSLTVFLSLAFILTGVAAVTTIVALAFWLPIEIKQDGETIKESGSLNFQANSKLSHD